jgi:predicted permease
MNLSAVGRLKLGSTPEAAQAELTGIMKRFLAANAPDVKLAYGVLSLADQAGRTVRRGLLILLGSVIFVLLIASANVASLLVARVANRQRELAVRAALGAGRRRIARQLVTENVVLATCGTAIGIAIAYWATKMMLSLVPGSMPRADDIGMDWRVLAFAAAIALVGGSAFGIAATMSVPWTRLAAMLHAGDIRSAGTVRQRFGRRVMVATEVALSLVLLVGASLLMRSFIELRQVEPGFDARSTLTAGVALPVAGAFNPLRDGPEWAAKLNAMTARLAEAPGVVAAGAVSSLPLAGGFESGGIRVVGEPVLPAGQGPSAQYNVVAGRYFDAVGIRVIAGRAFDSGDDAPGRRSLIVNQQFAVRHFGSAAAAIGRQVQASFEFTPDAAPRLIVGVVSDVRQSALDEDPVSQVYLPESQMSYPFLTFVARTAGDPLMLLPALRKAVHDVDGGATVKDVRTMDDVVEHSLARQRFSMTLIATFAGLALLLAIVGLYGVLTLIVGQRRREIGVRLALGAGPGDVVRMVVGESARVAGVGIVAGILAALALTRVLGSLLYGISATDAATFTAASVVVAAVALAATWAPARRAARMDPKDALTE